MTLNPIIGQQNPVGTICCPRLYFAGSSTLALAWRQSVWLQTRCTLVARLGSIRLVGWSYGVIVRTLDSESSDPGSNPGRTLQCAAPCGAEQSRPLRMTIRRSRGCLLLYSPHHTEKKTGMHIIRSSMPINGLNSAPTFPCRLSKVGIDDATSY